jgi:cyanobactin biosynthesis protein (PatB/AcyB/McaB family)
MKLPNQATPVFRTATGLIKDREQPCTVIDFAHASTENLLELSINLLAGANYNDPMRFLPSVNSYGGHILSGSSMAMCLAVCRLL